MFNIFVLTCVTYKLCCEQLIPMPSAIWQNFPGTLCLGLNNRPIKYDIKLERIHKYGFFQSQQHINITSQNFIDMKTTYLRICRLRNTFTTSVGKDFWLMLYHRQGDLLSRFEQTQETGNTLLWRTRKNNMIEYFSFSSLTKWWI